MTVKSEPTPSTRRTRLAVGATFWLFVLTAVVHACSGPNATSTRQHQTSHAKTANEGLKGYEEKISSIALEPLDRRYDPDGYAKLGKRVWSFSNEFRRWAALSAAQSAECNQVSAVSIWERATRANFAWHVTCSNGERFIISEPQARSVKAQLDPAATPGEKKKYSSPVEVAKPLSAVWDNFNEAGAVVVCENLLKDASINRNSFDTEGSPSIERDDDTGRATIYRDYSSDNALGGTISGKYQCLVDATGEGRIVTLKTRDALGLHSVFEQGRQ